MSDTGAHLRSLYAPDGGVRAIFSAKVADYVASRPDYPQALFDALCEHAGLGVGKRVADVGAGTGLLTRGLLECGATVTAIEPNPAMRAAADDLLGGDVVYPGRYRCAAGSAESMPLAAASVDLITAAQAFHWFEVEAARAEAQRVLKPAGQVALIWNDRRHGDALHDALDEVFECFGGDRRSALVAHEDRADVPRFFGSGSMREFAWPHEHRLDAPGLASLVFSRSYMPARDSAAGRDALAAVVAVYERFADRGAGSLAVRYTTVAVVGRPA
jgi:SAM-dependent methyltransferase